MSDKERFVTRWSRLKRDTSAEAPKEPPVKEERSAPALPPVDSLTPESDFSGFMAGGVQDSLRRAALKKLFSDPHFNVPDAFEPFSGDWTVSETIPEEMMATLNQARTLLFSEDEKTAAKDSGQAPGPGQDGEAEPEAADDDAGKQDA